MLLLMHRKHVNHYFYEPVALAIAIPVLCLIYISLASFADLTMHITLFIFSFILASGLTVNMYGASASATGS